MQFHELTLRFSDSTLKSRRFREEIRRKSVHNARVNLAQHQIHSDHTSGLPFTGSILTCKTTNLVQFVAPHSQCFMHGCAVGAMLCVCSLFHKRCGFLLKFRISRQLECNLRARLDGQPKRLFKRARNAIQCVESENLSRFTTNCSLHSLCLIIESKKVEKTISLGSHKNSRAETTIFGFYSKK